MPQILTANDLLEGDVVFLAANGWSRNINDAEIAHDKAAAKALEAGGSAAVAGNRVVEPYLIDIEHNDDGIEPIVFRERMRSLGPSVRRDLGKQANAYTK